MPTVSKVTATNPVLVPLPEGRMNFDSAIKAWCPLPFNADPMRYFDGQGKARCTSEITYKKT